MANRQATRDYVQTSMERLEALAGKTTTTEEDMAHAVAQTRREFIEAGMAAGFSRREIVKRANAMGLTPRMVKTVFEAAGIDATDLKARQLREVYRTLPKNVRSDIKANGIPETIADVNALDRKYKLTEKERRALITIKDLATDDVVALLAKLGVVDAKQATPTVVLGGAAAVQNDLASVSNWLDNLDGKTATTWVTTRRVGSLGATGSADGSTVPKTGLGYRDRHLYLLADGEEVISNRHGQADMWRPLLKAINDRRLAGGGTATLTARQARSLIPASSGARAWSNSDIDRIVRAIEDNRGVYAAVSSREDLQAAMRAIDRELRR
jgi:hypothetical protein